MNTQTRPRFGRLLAALAIPLLALSVLLVLLEWSFLPQPVYPQTLTAPQSSEPVTITGTAPSTAAAADSPTAPMIDCTKPPTGKKAKLFAEDEIVVASRSKSYKKLKNWIIDNSGQNLVLGSSWFYSGPWYPTDFDSLTDVRWPTIVAADMNGDGKSELVSAVRDKQKRISVMTNNAGATPWYSDNSHFTGDNVKWVNIAAGNLDRYGTDDEAVVAFSDNYNDLTVWVLDGNSAGNISHAPNYLSSQYHNDQAGRGDVSYVNVATGDLNGDGWNDEIVTVFKDGNSDLHVMIFRRDSTTLTVLYDKAWTNHDRGDVAKDINFYGNRRPIDVTTGDVDGDKRDEVILGFRSGPKYQVGQVQLLVLDQQAGGTYDDRVFYTRDAGGSSWQAAVTSVAVAAGDLEGDGQDEIVLGYNRNYVCVLGGDEEMCWQQVLLTYKYVPPLAPGWEGCLDDVGASRACLQERPDYWTSPNTKIPMFVSEVNVEADIAVDTGDLDSDGYAEIGLAREEHSSGNIQVISFDADSSLNKRSTYAVSQPDDRVEEFALSMGDQDGNSRYATYTNACREVKEAQVAAVIHAPPYWPHVNDEESESGFGSSVTNGAGTGKATESTVGGSVKLGFEVPKIEAGPSFTREWEKSAAVEKTVVTSTVEGDSFVTHPLWAYGEEGYFDAIEFVETKYWCYDYTEAQLGAMSVCLPRPPEETTLLNYPMEWWYEHGPATYSSSWVPVGINLAQGRTATQSGKSPAPPDLAVDGNTDGNYSNGSVSHTGYDTYAWWQVDLGGVQWIDAVQIWNRTDCCADRLTDFYVFISDDPFPSDNPFTLETNPDVWHHKVSGQGGRPTIVPVNFHGRYVRVQIGVTNYLDLAEVQVFGRPGAVNFWPTARPVTTTNTFTLAWPGSPNLQQTVNGQLMYARKGTQLGVRVGSGTAGFDLGLARDGEQVIESSTASKTSIGFETKYGGVEGSVGTLDKTSYILSWSREIEFSGEVNGLPAGTSIAQEYAYMPYVWLQRAKSSGGTNQAFLVLDYWVPYIHGTMAGEADAAADTTGELPQAGRVITPTVPLISSPTHPDPATWYTANTATFNWAQPPGDPATVDGYRWYLDHSPDTMLAGPNMVMTTTHTYNELADGVWYIHVRARSTGGQWSDTAHRGIRVDANPPEVSLAVAPALPTGNNGWYVTPVTVTVSATDGAGSGVAALQVSTDGVTWQPYTAALVFTADTPGATVWARATDAVGYISTPISTTFKIDRTPPSSHVTGGQGPGTWVAAVLTNTLDNKELVLLGAIDDALSGRAGMDLGFDDMDWTSAHPIGSWHPLPARPTIEVNWYFTATNQLGAGNHIFYGRAQDEAGNLETPYEIGRVVWNPEASPDLNGSSMSASPTTVRPGEIVTFTLVARNAGWQDALVVVTDTLPSGLTVVTGTLAPNVGYNPATNVLTWPARLLWPGESVRYSFEARAAAGLPVATLENSATAHAFWPNTETLPADQRQHFLSREQTVVFKTTVTVNPSLPAGADVTPPWAGLTVRSTMPQAVGGPQVPLGILASPDARYMYLREWTPDTTTGVWAMAHSSGWIDYTPTYTWTLSAGQGIKYIGVWVADAAHNVSVLDEHGLAFVNRIDGNQVLADGQRVQYRGNLQQGTWVVSYLTTLSGDPDLYAWGSFNPFRPDLYSNDSVAPGQGEGIGERLVHDSGRFLLEVQAVGASEYLLTLTGHSPASAATTDAVSAKELPRHPLVVSDPLGAGRTGTPAGLWPVNIYMPLIFKGS